MIGLDVHDVVVFGHRPVGAEYTVLAVMHRLFLAQPVEIGPERIGPKQFGIAGLELRKRYRIGVLPRGFFVGRLLGIHRPVHRAAPSLAYSMLVSVSTS